MFTGIVEDTGRVVAVSPRNPGLRIEVASGIDWATSKLGDSVAVSGVCLTIVALDADRVAFDLGPETLAVTTLGALAVGARVHLERAMRLEDRLGGHLVSGHVDAVGRIADARRDGDVLFLRVEAPPSVLALCVPKGSICVEGTSLTLNVVDTTGFDVCLIPHTLERTRLGDLRAGDAVNLEADLIGKYVARLLAPHLDRKAVAPSV